MEPSSGSHLDTEEFVEVEKREVTRECGHWSDLACLNHSNVKLHAACWEVMRWLQGAVRQACTLEDLLHYNTNAPVCCRSLLSTSKPTGVETNFTP